MSGHHSRSVNAMIQSGMTAAFYGDSISDPYYYGQYIDLICAQTGMKKLNTNLVPNADFEVDNSAWVVPNAWATVARSTAQHKSGAASLLIQPTATGAGSGINWAIASPEGDVGALRMGMVQGRTYTFAADVFVPANITTGNIYLSITDNDGTGQATSISTAITAGTAAWVRLTVTRTLRASTGSGTQEAFCRVNWSGTAGQVDAAKFFYVDNVQLEVAPTTSGYTTLTMPPFIAGSANRCALAGTLLTNNVADAARATSGITSFAARMGSLTPDFVVLAYGINDWYNANGYGITAAAWRTACATLIANTRALSSKPQVVWVGLTTTTTTAPVAPSTGWSGYSLVTRDDLKNAMNTIAREECMNADIPFVQIWPLMPSSYVKADLIHPTETNGQSLWANRIMSSLGAE